MLNAYNLFEVCSHRQPIRRAKLDCNRPDCARSTSHSSNLHNCNSECNQGWGPEIHLTTDTINDTCDPCKYGQLAM
ncbi:hypothetical protein BKA70DRAFT_1419002 [Coprinopsis sp. MPI-PUGE-AT-0042]|nr:hypothetical protein BKA70DRAFT_1419002 [Coprinopsis sp. MPI-PUGE-AT-0042]